MNDAQYVFTSDGRRGTIVADREPTTDDRRFLDVRFEDGALLHVPAELLDPRPDGNFDLALSALELNQASNATGRADTDATTISATDERVVVPVVAEELAVSTRTVERGVVRVRKLVHARDERVEQPLVREEVQVEHIPIGRVIDQVPGPRNEGDTLIIPVLEEVLVVEKRLVLKEEVRITRRRITEPSTQDVTLRTEEVVVERDLTTDMDRA